jgi:hypothetical protein
MSGWNVATLIRRPLLEPDAARLEARNRAVTGFAKRAKLREALDLVRLVARISPADRGEVAARFHGIMRKGDEKLGDKPTSFDVRCLATAALHEICLRSDLVGRATAAAVRALCVVGSGMPQELSALPSNPAVPTLSLPLAHVPDASDALAAAKEAHAEASKSGDSGRRLTSAEAYIGLLEARATALSKAASNVDQSAGGWRSVSAVLAWLSVAETEDGRRYSELPTASVVASAPLTLVGIAKSVAAVIPAAELLSSVLGARASEELAVSDLARTLSDAERDVLRRKFSSSANRDLTQLTGSLMGDARRLRDRVIAGRLAVALYDELVVLDLGREDRQ